jgi:hypothetical protein
MCGELQDSALAVGTSRDDTDVCWVVDSCDDAGCQDDLLPVKRRISELHNGHEVMQIRHTRSCQC